MKKTILFFLFVGCSLSVSAMESNGIGLFSRGASNIEGIRERVSREDVYESREGVHEGDEGIRESHENAQERLPAEYEAMMKRKTTAPKKKSTKLERELKSLKLTPYWCLLGKKSTDEGKSIE